jgi:hypothetical protein
MDLALNNVNSKILLVFLFFISTMTVQTHLSRDMEQKGTRVLLLTRSHEPSIHHPTGCACVYLRQNSSCCMGYAIKKVYYNHNETLIFV